MFFDFNIPYSHNASDLPRLSNILSRIQSMGRATVALNIETQDPFTSKAAEPIRPIAPDRFPDIRQLKRVTVAIAEPKKNLQLVASNVANQSVDILAAKPLNGDAAKHACQTYEVDIISIDCMAKRIVPSHAIAQVALERGIFFEICYTGAMPSASEKQRSFFLSNIRRLVEVTRGNNLIFSSEATSAMDIRSSNDLKMLGLLLGMRKDQVEAALGHNYHRLLLKAETRQRTINAAIRVDYIVPEDESKKRKEPDTSATVNESAKQNKKKKKNKQQQQQQQQK
ncbi:RNase P subunit p30-domain-containing protein [Dichotomocladium elegans]|nr:RNase P subunit p30-domain-containing protein [Dichotomocladium elegans]